MAKQDFYTTPASKLGMTAKALVTSRVEKVIELAHKGKKIQNTTMLQAFAAAV